MRKILSIFLFFISVESYSQHFSGRLDHFTGSYFNIDYAPDWLSRQGDTIHVNEKGEFNFRFRMQYPARIKLMLSSKIVQEIFIAPGLSLNIKADVSNENSYDRSLRFSGTAARYNLFFPLLQASTRYKYFDYSKNYDVYDKLPVNEKLNMYKSLKFTRDSIRQQFFSNFKKDTLAIQFSIIDSIETQYMVLSGLHGILREIPEEEKLFFVRKHWSPFMIENDDPMIISGWSYYFTWYVYVNDLYKLAIASGDTAWLRSQNEYERISDYFVRIVASPRLIEKMYVTFYLREMVAHYRLLNENDFPAWDSAFERMSLRVSSKPVIEDFRRRIETNKALAILSKKGGPAPDFVLKDSSGRNYRLSDFKDKLLVLDLWASWCKPCISEFPHMKKIEQKFADRNDIIFVNISTDYNRLIWIEEGLRRFFPPGLALWASSESNFAKDYKVSSFPHFIVIDKNGKFVEYSAPYPSEGNKLENLIMATLQQ